MKKLLFVLLFAFAAAALFAQDIPGALQKRNLVTDKDFADAVNLFSNSEDDESVLAAAAALADCPPPKTYANKLYDMVISSDGNGLRRFFAAVILASMSADNKELLPSLENAYSSARDPVLKAYAAAAASIINPSDKTKSDAVVSLYPHDKIFALKAVNALYPSEKQIISALKDASGNKNAGVRTGAAQMLGNFINEKSAAVLFKMLEKEKDADAGSAVAFSLSRMPQFSARYIPQCLKIKYSSRPAFTCSLALGFMPGDGFEILKQSLSNSDEDTQINALRAAAVTAEALAGKNASSYSSDVKFDKHNLKTLTALVASLSANGKTGKIKDYADAAAQSFRKIM